VETPQFDLNWIDYAVVAVYFVGVLAHGLYVSRKNESADDYFLAGGVLPWWLIGFSLFASNMSGSSFVGLMGASYEYGMAVFNYEWTAALVLIVFALLILPHFLRNKIYTVPGFLEHRYDKRSRLAFSGFTLLAILFVDTAGALYAGGLVITTVMPFLNLWAAVAVLALVAGLYTILGGLGAVVVTDTVQAILLIVGAALIFYFGLQEIGGWDRMLANTPEDRMSLIRSPNDDFLPWPGLFGVILLGFYYWTLNQFVVQRALGARNLDQGRKGAIFAGFLKLPNLFLMIVPGIFAISLYPDLEKADLVFPTLAFDLLPIGLRGIVMAALIAAIMSSLDSALNAASTLFTMDFVRHFRPKTQDKTLVRIGRVTTGAVMVFGAIYAPSIASFETLFSYFQSALSYLIPTIVAVYLGGMLWRGFTAGAGFWTIVLGLAIGIPLFVLKEVTGIWTDTLGLPAIHYTYMSSVLFFGGIALMFAISYAEGLGRSEIPANYEIRPARRQAVWADYRYQSGAVALLCAAALAYFW
jgi:SSS family solute:Na+ symporter